MSLPRSFKAGAFVLFGVLVVSMTARTVEQIASDSQGLIIVLVIAGIVAVPR